MSHLTAPSAQTASGLDHQVAVVGAGPTGLLVASELATAGVDVVVLDRLATPDLTIKAGSVNVATAEIFDRRGLRPAAQAAQQRFSEELTAFAAAHGTPLPTGGRPAGGTSAPFPSTGHFAGLFFRPDLVDQSDPRLTAHPGAGSSVMVRQSETEALLGAHAASLGVQIARGVEVAGIEPLLGETGTETGMLLLTSRGPLRVGWVVGADGGRSRLRHLVGIDFVGTDPETTGYQAIADMDGLEGLRPGWNHTPTGVYSLGPIPGRILTVQFTGAPDRAVRDQPVTAEELQASIRLVTGHPVTVTSIHGRATRWTDNARQAVTYRAGRVLLAGDAAHVHSPFSGQGLNLGAGDAVNLGWKLAGTVHGWAPAGLLDTYTSERHPIGAQVLDWTRAQIALMRGDEKTSQLRRIVQEDMLANTAGTTRMVLSTSGVAQRYDLGTSEDDTTGHPLVGAVIGDAPLSDGSRLADHFHTARFVLLDRLAGSLAETGARWPDRLVTLVEDTAAAECPEHYRALTGLLVRPDGIIAWATDTTDRNAAAAGLTTALSRWAGAASPTHEADHDLRTPTGFAH
jgi:2-polyprenyl-6-methoxyphenol hydroxylase-like FAD-dependent oxidoreductase